MFPEKIAMLNHCALERLKDDAPLLQRFGNNIALNKLIAGENHRRGNVAEPARLFEDGNAIVVTQRSAKGEWREIDKINIGKTPKLIFAGGLRQSFELLPGRALLFAEPIRNFARLARTQEDPLQGCYFIMCD